MRDSWIAYNNLMNELGKKRGIELQKINVGKVVNDCTGDSMQAAISKVMQNSRVLFSHHPNARLVEFAKFCLWQGGDWCGGIDGDELQDMAEKLGLIEEYTATEPCCDECMCAEVYEDFPAQCYRYTEVMKMIEKHGTG